MMKAHTGIRKGIYIIPNLFTTASLFFGFYSIIRALHHDFVVAAWAIALSGICDILDGRVARLTHTESQFGIEYDSLVDLVAFGLAPGVLVYSWSLASFDRLGAMVTFLYVACGCLRLARFNVQVDNVEKDYFQGLPIPCASAPLVTVVLLYDMLYGRVFPVHNWPLVWLTVGLALLMVSTVRYRSFKTLNYRSRWSFFLLVVVVGMIMLIAQHPEYTLFAMAFGYVFSGIIEELVTMRQARSIVGRMRQRRSERRARRAARRKIHTIVHSGQHGS